MDDADDSLTRLAIRQALEAEDQYSEVVEPGGVERVGQLRRIGRAVARELGWKIQTVTVPLDEGATQVVLAVTESAPLRDRAMEARRQRKMREAIHKL